MPKHRFLICGVVLTFFLALAGCSTSSPTSSQFRSAIPTNGATVCASAPATPATAQPHAWFVQAKKEWQLGQESDNASMGECWERASVDLYAATNVAASPPMGFDAASNELAQLSALPDNMLTPTQLNLDHGLIRKLNAFFGTKGAYGVSPTVPTTTTTTSRAVPPGQLPISVESDSQMQAEGNNGPSSSILDPTSCEISGTTATARGTIQTSYEAYNRYGDIIVLYVFGPSSTGYPQGPQIGVSSASTSPPVGAGSWQVSAPIDSGMTAARCVVAAQPTHDEQLAP